MGRVKGRKQMESGNNDRISRTVDLSVERGYAVTVPTCCRFEIGKIHGIGNRKNQEDAFGVSELNEADFKKKGAFFVVADGMGGMADGGKASTAAVICCLQYFDRHDSLEENGEMFWMRDMVLDANDDVIDVLDESAGMGGSTLVAVRILKNCFQWIAVGDSRLYLYRDNVLHQLNEEHIYEKTLYKLVEEHKLTAEDVENHPQRKALTSFIGKRGLKEMAEGCELQNLKSGDWLLLMTDGVFGTLSEEEIINILQFSAGKAAMRMGMQIEQKRKGHQDNYTALLIRVI